MVSLSNSAQGDVNYQQDNSSHLLVGGGIEWMRRRGLGLRAEVIAYDEDAQSSQLALLYRFGSGDSTSRQQVVSD